MDNLFWIFLICGFVFFVGATLGGFALESKWAFLNDEEKKAFLGAVIGGGIIAVFCFFILFIMMLR